MTQKQVIYHVVVTFLVFLVGFNWGYHIAKHNCETLVEVAPGEYDIHTGNVIPLSERTTK